MGAPLTEVKLYVPLTEIKALCEVVPLVFWTVSVLVPCPLTIKFSYKTTKIKMIIQEIAKKVTLKSHLKKYL